MYFWLHFFAYLSADLSRRVQENNTTERREVEPGDWNHRRMG